MHNDITVWESALPRGSLSHIESSPMIDGGSTFKASAACASMPWADEDTHHLDPPKKRLIGGRYSYPDDVDSLNRDPQHMNVMINGDKRWDLCTVYCLPHNARWWRRLSD